MPVYRIKHPAYSDDVSALFTLFQGQLVSSCHILSLSSSVLAIRALLVTKKKGVSCLWVLSISRTLPTSHSCYTSEPITSQTSCRIPRCSLLVIPNLALWLLPHWAITSSLSNPFLLVKHELRCYGYHQTAIVYWSAFLTSQSKSDHKNDIVNYFHYFKLPAQGRL